MAFLPLVDRPSVSRRVATTVVAALCLVLGPLADVPAQAAGTYTVTGTVSGDGVGPLDDMPVELQRYEPGTQTFEVIALTDTNVRGAYTFSDVSDGTFRVHVVSDGKYVDGFSAPFTPPGGLTVPVITVQHGGSVSGRVLQTGTTNTPIEDATIEGFPTGGAGGPASVTTTTDETGAFLLGGLPPGGVTIQIRDEQGNHVSEYYDNARTLASAKTVAVQKNANTALSAISLDVGATFAGRVTDTGGSPVEGVAVRALPTDGSTPDAPLTYSDGDGQYVVEGLAAGTYTIQFGDNPGYFDQAYPSPQAVTSGQSKSLAVTVLERTAEVTGTVTDVRGVPLGGIVVDALPVSAGVSGAQSSVSATTARDGSFVLRQLHAGTYRLRASDSRRAYLDRFFDEDITVEGGESADATGVAMSLAPVPVPPAPSAPPTVVKKSASVKVSAKGARKKATLKVRVTARGVTPTGRITIRVGSKKLKTVTLKRGRATVTLTRQKKGKRTYTIVYSGDSTVRGKSVTSKVRIR
jgi:hypothetical protein